MPDLNDWLSLPELAVPDDGHLEVLVIRAAFIGAPASELRAVGIAEPVMVDRECDLGAVGLVTIESGVGPAWLRLPNVLAAWAVECWAMAETGGKPFPSRVRFTRHGTAFAAVSLDAPGPNPVSTLPCPEDPRVFIDESGNTGDAVVYTPTGAFQGQPSFALACVGDAADGARLTSIMDRLRAKYSASSKELKGRAAKKWPRLTIDLLGMLYEDGVPIFIELMDKWHYVATNITTFVLGKAPWFEIGSPASREVAHALADLIVEDLGPTVLGAYNDFAQTPDVNTLASFEATLRRQLTATHPRMQDGQRRELLEIAQALTDDAFAAYQHNASRDPRAHERLLPEPDLTRGGNPIAMMAHVPAFTSLYGRVNQYAREARTVEIIHDEQQHVDHVLRAYAETLGSNVHAKGLAQLAGGAATCWHFEPGKFSLNFKKSDVTPGIQVADILARFCTQRMNDVIADKSVASHEVAGLLGVIRDHTGSAGLQHRVHYTTECPILLLSPAVPLGINMVMTTSPEPCAPVVRDYS